MNLLELPLIQWLRKIDVGYLGTDCGSNRRDLDGGDII